jgi:hypothetical protein
MDIDIDLDNLTEDDLKAFIEDVIEDMVNTGEIEAGENFEDDVDVEVEEEDTEEIEIDEAKDEDVLKAITSEEKKEEMDESKKEEMDEAKHEKEDMKEDLDEAYSTIETLKGELNEINLLNSKLLYTNKIFKAKNLTEAQKVKVLGAFDKASSVKEAKLIYETLQAGVANKKASVNAVRGRASKAIQPVEQKQPIVESDQMVARFKKLAGLI